MTLVYRSQKSSSINKQNQLGPGSYNIQNKNKNIKQSSIFTSNTKRDAFNLDKIQKEQEQKLEKLKNKNKKNNILKKNENNLNQQDIIIHQQQFNKQQQESKQHLTRQYQQISSGYNQLSYSTKKGSNIAPCNHIFNSKVQRFSSESVDLKYQIVTQQKLNELLLADEFKKLLVKDNNNNKNNVNHNSLPKSTSFKPNLRQLQQKKRPLIQLQQKFPSIPTWQKSYGYRKDPLTNKLISNQNPNKIFQIQQINKQQQKNQCKGAGYYLYKQKDNKINNNNKRVSNNINKHQYQYQQNKQRELLNFMQCPKNYHESIDYNTIQQKQNKIKYRNKLLGQHHIIKVNQYQQQNYNLLKLYEKNKSTYNNQKKDKKAILLQYQMLKQFNKYIPKNQQPIEYFKKLQEMKRSQILQNNSNLINNRSSNHSQKNSNFLSKSNRFNLQKYNQMIKNDNKITTSVQQSQTSTPISQQTNRQTSLTSSIILKTFNKKQPYSLGEQRFHKKALQSLGPGSYNPLQSLSYIKPSISTPLTLQLKQHRFGPQKYNNQSPGPGEYYISKEIGQKANLLSQLYINYKEINKQQLRKKFNKQVSMEALYQTWGKQMSFRIKQDRIGQKLLKLQTENQQKNHNHNLHLNNNKSKHNKNLQYINQTNYQSNQHIQNKQNINIDNISITKTKKQLQKQMDKLKNNQNNQIQQNILKPNINNIIHPKIIKHLYQYKQLDPIPAPIGPGSYEIRKQLDKKTYNVTYTSSS